MSEWMNHVKVVCSMKFVKKWWRLNEMVYVIAILVFIGIYIFGWFCGFSTGSYHGYGKALDDMKELIARKDEDNE